MGGGKLRAGGRIAFGEGGVISLDNSDGTPLSSAQMVFAGRLILNILAAIQAQSRDGESIPVVTEPATSSSSGGTLVTQTIPVATFSDSASGSFSAISVAGNTDPCQTVLAARQVTSGSTVSVAVDLRQDTTSTGCATG